jgi:hypothetical protein
MMSRMYFHIIDARNLYPAAIDMLAPTGMTYEEAVLSLGGPSDGQNNPGLASSLAGEGEVVIKDGEGLDKWVD